MSTGSQPAGPDIAAFWDSSHRGVVLRMRRLSLSPPPLPESAPGTGGARYVLREVNLDLVSGRWVVLTGPPGAGKTSLLRCAVGPVPGLEGEVLPAPGMRRAQVGLESQGDRVRGTATLTELMINSVGAEAALSERILRRLELWQQRDFPVGSLPTGERGRAELALALAGSPDLLVVDDLTSHLGPDSAGAALGLLRELVDAGLCVLMAADDLKSIAQADTVVLLADGQIVGEEELPPRAPTAAE